VKGGVNQGTTHYVWDIFGQIIAEADGSTGVTLRDGMGERKLGAYAGAFLEALR
jgi:hypothetical protein